MSTMDKASVTRENDTLEQNAAKHAANPLMNVLPKVQHRPSSPMASSMRTIERDIVFFRNIASCGTIDAAAKEAEYSYRSVFEWRKEDPEFADIWDEAKGIALETLERNVDERAFHGTIEAVHFQGVVVDYVRKFSDRLAEFRLKALAPEKYRERKEITGSGGTIVAPVITVTVNK